MRDLLPLLLLLSLPTLPAAAEPPRPDFRSFDHADPWQLNEAAADSLSQPTPDLGTARILLERAALLAPEQSEILANREALRRLQDGRARLALPETPAPTAPTQTNSREEDAPLELWPR